MVNRKSGFTLLEMLVVVGILGILMATAVAGMAQAKRQGRTAKAHADIRALVNAWFAYEAANDDWPANINNVKGDPVETSEDVLKELIGKGKDQRVYLNAPIRNGYFRDPWGTPYKLKITSQDLDKETNISDVFSAAVTFPNRNRPPAW